jgi:hypothetical protein
MPFYLTYLIDNAKGSKYTQREREIDGWRESERERERERDT